MKWVNAADLGDGGVQLDRAHARAVARVVDGEPLAGEAALREVEVDDGDRRAPALQTPLAGQPEVHDYGRLGRDGDTVLPLLTEKRLHFVLHMFDAPLPDRAPPQLADPYGLWFRAGFLSSITLGNRGATAHTWGACP